MSSDKIFKDDALKGLLKRGRPEPDAAFSGTVRETLAGLPDGGAGARRSFAVRRPLLIILIVLLTLVIGTGVAFAAGAFGDVFGSALSKAQNERQEYLESYDEKREEIENMEDPMDAAIADNEMDAKSEHDVYALAALTGAEEHSVEINQTDGELTLSQFSAVVLDAYRPGEFHWTMYVGFAAPKGFSYEHELNLRADGMSVRGELTDFAAQSSDTEEYAIYECVTCINFNAMHETSLVSVECGGHTFCFLYCWKDESFILPSDDAQRAEWHERNLALTAEYSALHVAPKPGGAEADGFYAKLVGGSLEGNVVTLSVEITISPELSGYTVNLFELGVTVDGAWYDHEWPTFIWPRTPYDFSVDPSRIVTFKLVLPECPTDLVGEELTLNFTLFAYDPEIDMESQLLPAFDLQFTLEK